MITGAAYTEQECETSEAGSWMVVNESRMKLDGFYLLDGG